MNCPKILVSSIDVWNSESGSDTFTNLLSGYDSEKVANIFFRSGIPTSGAANKYFFISENAVIKSIIKKDTTTGWEVSRCTDGYEKKQMDECKTTEKRRYSFFTKHRWWVFLFAREFLWKIGKWKSEELDNFIEEYKPEVLFCPIESYIYFNRVNEYIIKKIGIPLITYMWDDNFSYKGCNGIGSYIHRFFLRRSVKRLIEKSSEVFAISPKMKTEIEEEYGVNVKLLTKGIKPHSIQMENCSNSPLKMIYTGKLAYGRYETIALVSKILGKVNSNGVRVEFDIYTGSVLKDEEVESFSSPGVHFCGCVPQTQIAEIQRSADILLMAEALGGKHKYDARLSISTKVVDYLGAGKCIVAIGLNDIASIEYLSKNKAALCASTVEEIEELFAKIDEDTIISYACNAYKLGQEKHNIYDIQKGLYSEFEDCVMKESINSDILR